MKKTLCILGITALLCGCGATTTENPATTAESRAVVAEKTDAVNEAGHSEAIAPSQTKKATPSSSQDQPAGVPASETDVGSANENTNVPESPPAKPATVEAAAQLLDLRTFPLLPGTKEPPSRSLAQLSYRTNATPKAAYEFLKEKLGALKWQELPNGNVSDEGVNATFSQDGYNVALSVFKTGGDEGEIHVSLNNLGNVDPKNLPVPEGAKLLYEFPNNSAYVADASVEETLNLIGQKLLAVGWTPYGDAGDTQYFKQNAMKLSVRVASAPAQDGKT